MKTQLFDLDNWSEIFSTLSRNKMRTFMTGFGIFWGTAILALCFGGGRGFQGMMSRNFQGFATNAGGVIPQTTTEPFGGYNKGRYWSLTDNDIAQMRSTVAGLALSTAVNQAQSVANQGTKTMSVAVMGIEPDYWKIQEFKMLDGRLINDADLASQRKVAVLGVETAAQLFVNQEPVGQKIDLDGVYYTVVGVVGQMSQVSIGGNVDRGVVLPATTMRAAYNIINPSYMVYTSKNGITPKEVAQEMKSILRHNHSIAPNDEGAIYIMDVSEMFDMVQKVYLGIDLLAIFVGMGTLIAGVIGVGNIMWIIVKERTQEFGIRRAIGATPSDITVQILSESVVLTTISGLGGISFAAIILGIIDHFNYDPWLGKPGFEISFTAAVTILALFLVLGSAAGIIPAIKAMKVKPIEAMNDK